MPKNSLIYEYINDDGSAGDIAVPEIYEYREKLKTRTLGRNDLPQKKPNPINIIKDDEPFLEGEGVEEVF